MYVVEKESIVLQEVLDVVEQKNLEAKAIFVVVLIKWRESEKTDRKKRARRRRKRTYCNSDLQ